MVKLAVIVFFIVAAIFSVWKNSVGLVGPLILLWGYGMVNGFSIFSIKGLMVLTIVHTTVLILLWWFSGRMRQKHLALTSLGIIGFGTGLLASLFLGALVGFFMWWGLLGRLIVQPVAINIKPIARSFMAGILKVIYVIIISGVVSYFLFQKG